MQTKFTIITNKLLGRTNSILKLSQVKRYTGKRKPSEQPATARAEQIKQLLPWTDVVRDSQGC